MSLFSKPFPYKYSFSAFLGFSLILMFLLLFQRAEAARIARPLNADSALEKDWLTVDPENLLVIDTSRGRIFIELYPAIAPKTVERIKILTRQHFYDGLVFFRVIDGFMAQTGDPKNTGEGGSNLPNLTAEFQFRRSKALDFMPLISDHGEISGLLGGMPVASQSDALMDLSQSGDVAAWGVFCSGIMGMARADSPDSANSQFFITRDRVEGLDQKYTAFGRVLYGLSFVRLIKTGEPVSPPQDKVMTLRLASDLPISERPQVKRLDVNSSLFQKQISILQTEKGHDFHVCDVDIPVKITPVP